MRATLMYGAGDGRVEEVPDSVVKQPTDALVRVTGSCVCGSALWPYGSMKPADGPARMGHEFIGIVEDTVSEVTTVRRVDLVVAPFAVSDNTCAFCREGLHTSCTQAQAGFWDGEADEGGQAEAVRVPLADGTLVKLPADSALGPVAVHPLGRVRHRLPRRPWRAVSVSAGPRARPHPSPRGPSPPRPFATHRTSPDKRRPLLLPCRSRG